MNLILDEPDDTDLLDEHDDTGLLDEPDDTGLPAAGHVLVAAPSAAGDVATAALLHLPSTSLRGGIPRATTQRGQAGPGEREGEPWAGY